MGKLIKMPSIPQFRNVITDVSRRAKYDGVDENGNAKYKTNATLPTITFTGTIKLHGTNASVCMNKEGELWAQSKGNVITVEKDNAGFAFFVEQNREYFEEKLKYLVETFKLESVCVYGEWVGKGIQKGVAISEIEKSFFAFGIKFLVEEGEDFMWSVKPETILKNLKDPERKIYSIFDYKQYEVTIDFNDTVDVKEKQNEMVKIVEEVEKSCPVAKEFGHEGIGEGVVWVGWNNDDRYVFKTKGEKHTTSKVKKLKVVDSEAEKRKVEFANKVTPAWRLEQMYAETFDTLNGGKGDIKRTGDFLKAVVNDVLKEEKYLFQEYNFEPKDVNSLISKIARQWFMEQLDKEVYGEV